LPFPNNNDYKLWVLFSAMKKGIFIAFEGIDGCGKSTQIRKLVEHIFELSKHNHIILTRNPYKDTNIRRILSEDMDPLSRADKLAELFINDRKNQTAEIIVPNLANGHFVISDRYKLSTITYQGAQGIDAKSLIARHDGMPVPDITFIVDVSARVASARMKREDVTVRGKEHKFEANLDFLESVRQNLLNVGKELPEEKIFVVNGDRAPEEIAQEIREIFDREFGKIANPNI